MKEVILNPQFLACVVVVVPAFLAYLSQRNATRDKYRKSKLGADAKKDRLIRWYAEKYHIGRMLLIQNNLGELVDEHLPFDPPENLLDKESESA